MGLQVPPFREWFCIGNLLLLVLGIGLVLGEVGADNHETQQVVKIIGTVVDNDTEMPIAEVSIRVVDTQIRGTTDETGAFSRCCSNASDDASLASVVRRMYQP